MIEGGALADILILNGNPLQNLEIFKNAKDHIAVIIKDGNIIKNMIQP